MSNGPVCKYCHKDTCAYVGKDAGGAWFQCRSCNQWMRD